MYPGLFIGSFILYGLGTTVIFVQFTNDLCANDNDPLMIVHMLCFIFGSTLLIMSFMLDDIVKKRRKKG